MSPPKSDTEKESKGLSFKIFLTILALLAIQSPAHITLQFASSEYLFQKANATVFRSDTLKALSRERGNVDQVKKLIELTEVSVSEGSSESIAVSRPGIFNVLLANLQIVRLEDRKQFHVPYFRVDRFSITQADLDNGVARIEINPAGVFRIQVLDKQGHAMADRLVTFHNAEQNFQIPTNEAGEILFLGDPADYYIDLPASERDSFQIQVSPL